MSSDVPAAKADALSPLQVRVLAVVCAFAIATLYYGQPILPLIGATFGTSDAVTSQIVMLGQIGYALGLFLFVPIGDRIDRRRLNLILLSINTVGVKCAFAPNFALFGVATVVAGLTTVTPQNHHSDRGRHGIAGEERPRGRRAFEWHVGRLAVGPNSERVRR
jgi:MFS family permease